MADVAFAISSTARRVCVRLLITLATIFRWQVTTIDIAQSFLQSTNLNDSPPPTIALPWKSEFPPATCDLQTPNRSRTGCLMARPLYGGRDAPERWFVAFSTILRKAG